MNVFEIAVVLRAVDRATKVIQSVNTALKGTRAVADASIKWGEKAQQQGYYMQQGADQIRSLMGGLVSPSQDVEEAMANVETVIGAVADKSAALQGVRDASFEWARAHRDSATSFLDSSYAMLSAGLNQQASIEGTRQAMILARGTNGEASVAAQLLATLYNNMGDTTKDLRVEMTHLADVMAQTQAVFQIKDLNQLNEGMKYAVPAALQAGMAIEDTSTIIGFLNTAGIAGSQAGTSFAATMRMMGRASKDLKFEIVKTSDGGIDFMKTVQGIEKKFGPLGAMTDKNKQKFQDAFGADGWMGLALMLNDTDKLANNLAAVRDGSEGVAATMAAIKEGTSKSGLDILNNAWTELKVTLGDHLGPVIKDVQPALMNIIATLGGFAKAHPDLVKTVLILLTVAASIMAVLAPILMVTGSMMIFGGHTWKAIMFIGGAFKWLAMTATPFLAKLTWGALKFAAALLANPITWIVLAIVAAIALIYFYWEPISGFFLGLWASIRAAFNDGFVMGILRVLQMMNPITWVVRAFDAITQYLFGFSLIDAGSNILSSLWEGMKRMAHKPVELMRSVAASVRALLPFSPAKEGPLKDIHKIRLIETIAAGIKPAPLTMAVTAAAAMAAASLPLAFAGPGGGVAGAAALPAAMPAFAPVITPAPSAQQGGGDVYFSVTVQGNATPQTVAEFERMLRNNQGLIVELVKRQQALSQRSELT